MDLIIDFDVQEMLEYEDSGSPLIFEINWKIDDKYYPMENWTDFGVVIIGWWIRSVLDELPTEGEGELRFMDGPYSIRLNYRQSQGVVEFLPDLSQTSLTIAPNRNMTYKDLLSKLLQACIKIKTELEQNNIGLKKHKEQKSLRLYITNLEKALNPS